MCLGGELPGFVWRPEELLFDKLYKRFGVQYFVSTTVNILLINMNNYTCFLL